MKKKSMIICIYLVFVFLLNACTVATEETSEILKTEETSEADAAIVESYGKVFEGRYFDEGVYRYLDMPETESPFIYCEITVSNVTNTSFDFTINETVMATGEHKNIMPLHTAVFIEDGTRAAYHDDNRSLYFTFPDEPDLYPKHMEISGLKQVEGNVYINNSIPGHESG